MTGKTVGALVGIGLGAGAAIAGLVVALGGRRGGLGAIEPLPGGAVVVVTGRDIPVYRLLALKHALRLETMGLKMSRGPSAYSIIKREFGLKGDKRKVLAEFERLVETVKAARGASA